MAPKIKTRALYALVIGLASLSFAIPAMWTVVDTYAEGKPLLMVPAHTILFAFGLGNLGVFSGIASFVWGRQDGWIGPFSPEEVPR